MECVFACDGIIMHPCTHIIIIIIAICEPGCINGGDCIAPNICECFSPFYGPRCAEGNACSMHNYVNSYHSDVMILTIIPYMQWIAFHQVGV